MIECRTYTATIFVSGSAAKAQDICQAFCMEEGLCVTVEPIPYIYTGGCEAGVRVGLINYPRFPAEPEVIFETALRLAKRLRDELAQWSFTIVATDKTVFDSTRVETTSPAPRPTEALEAKSQPGKG